MKSGWLIRCLTAAFVVAACGSAQAETLLERGTYLMRGIVACGNCHTPKDGSGRELAGGFVIEAPPFRAVASNITPDRETGIGTWSDQEIVDAIRNGRRPDGRLLGPPMPFEDYRKMSDRDARAIVAYLRAVKPVSNKVEASVYRMPLPPTYGPTVAGVVAPRPGVNAVYGEYLSDLGHCMDCHSPRVRGQSDRTRVGGGGMEFTAPAGGVILSSNLTRGNPGGIASWTDAQLAHAIRHGERPDGGKLVPLMAFDSYRTINDRDMAALIVYLRGLPPVAP